MSRTFKLHRRTRFGKPWFDKNSYEPYICFKGIREYFNIPANTQRIDIVMHSKSVKGALMCEIIETDPEQNKPYVRFNGNKKRVVTAYFWNALLRASNSETKVWIEFYYYPV